MEFEKIASGRDKAREEAKRSITRSRFTVERAQKGRDAVYSHRIECAWWREEMQCVQIFIEIETRQNL